MTAQTVSKGFPWVAKRLFMNQFATTSGSSDGVIVFDDYQSYNTRPARCSTTWCRQISVLDVFDDL